MNELFKNTTMTAQEFIDFSMFAITVDSFSDFGPELLKQAIARLLEQVNEGKEELEITPEDVMILADYLAIVHTIMGFELPTELQNLIGRLVMEAGIIAAIETGHGNEIDVPITRKIFEVHGWDFNKGVKTP